MVHFHSDLAKERQKLAGLHRGWIARAPVKEAVLGAPYRGRPPGGPDGHPGLLQHHRQGAQTPLLRHEGCQWKMGKTLFSSKQLLLFKPDKMQFFWRGEVEETWLKKESRLIFSNLKRAVAIGVGKK